MTAGTRPAARSFFAPVRLASVRGCAVNETEFMPFKFLLRPAALSGHDHLAGPTALKFKKRSNRRITVDSLDRFAQQSRHREGGNLYPVYRRAQDSISCYQFVNL